LLKVRLLLATVILAPLLTIVYLDYTVADWAPGLFLVPLAFLVSAMAAGEVHSLLHHQLKSHPVWPVIVGSLGVMLACAMPMGWDLLGKDYPANCAVGPAGWPVIAMAIAVMVLFALEIRRFTGGGGGGQGEHLAALSGQIMAVVYAGLLPSFLILLRRFRDNDTGMLALVSLLVITKMGDTMAYAFGKTMGKRKLSPLLSPGKTVEGAFGSMLGAVGSGLACGLWLQPALTETTATATELIWWATLGLAVGLFGMAGDLAESLLKRDAGKKDSSSWMPGLGGILDVLDSVLFAAPVAYIFWIAK
jgi:phosphatidate cytidylyltransferase